jgi:hypothetical protein
MNFNLISGSLLISFQILRQIVDILPNEGNTLKKCIRMLEFIYGTIFNGL